MAVTLNASTTAGLVQTADTSGVLALQTAGTTAVNVDASQNVGIGTASPDAKLRIDGTNGARVRFGFTTGGLDYGIYQSDQGGVDANYFANNVGIGVPAPACILDISGSAGGQIKFPATQNASSDANTLDDYEEGTWTPSIGGNATYTGQSGRYTKIGNFVSALCDMTINVIGTGSTSTVSGLPFAAGGLNFGGALSYWNQTSRGLYFLAPQITGTTFWFIDTTSAMTTPNNSAGIFQNGTRIIVTVTYQVF